MNSYDYIPDWWISGSTQIDTSIGCSPDEYYRFYGTLEECQAYIKEHENEPNLGIIP